MSVDLQLPYSETHAAPAGPVTITPTRRQIDDRFPVLVFTVDTGGRPFFEVLLTTDRALFNAANAGRRTASTFFASREHGLLRGGAEPAVYHVPAAVLQGFAGVREIFYTAVAYDNEQAANPAFAQPPATLATDAPSVLVAAGFRGRTMSMLSVPVDKLLRVRDDSVASAAAASPVVDAYSSAMPESYSLEAAAEADRLDGEDGYGQSAALEDDEETTYGAYAAEEPEYEPEPMQAAAAQSYRDSYSDGYSDGFDGDIDEAAPAMAASLARAYGDEAEWAEPEAAAQESSYPAGAQPPETLEDEDERARYGDEAMAESYGAYDDAPAYQPLEMEALQSAAQELTPQEQVRILQLIARLFESGTDAYAAINADGEFAGRFHGHSATGRYHIGLSWGFIQFTQDSGMLGEVLTAMRQRDQARFDEVFGSDAAELLRVTTARGASSRETPPRGVRVQPVGGADLWQEPWLGRFRTAGAHPAFQAAQNEVAARHFIGTVRPFARALGLDSQRAVAMVVDRAIQMGPTGATHWIVDAVTPVPTEPLRNSALSALGHANLAALQHAEGITADGVWGHDTHVAMIAALRALPPGRSPVPIPTREQMLDAIVRRAQNDRRPWARRPQTLRTSADLSDTLVFAL